MSRSVLARNLVLSASVLFLAALTTSSAHAISFAMGGVNGQDVTPGVDQVEVTVTLDTGATTGVTLWSIGVVFDKTRLSYNLAASSNNSYIFYGARGANYFTAASSCGGAGFPAAPPNGQGCAELAGQFAGQVNVDFSNVDLTNGSNAAATGVSLLATLVFDVLANPGAAAITITQTGTGNVVGTAGGGTTVAGLSGSGSVNVVPEPTTALLVALGLAGLGIAGRRK